MDPTAATRRRVLGTNGLKNYGRIKMPIKEKQQWLCARAVGKSEDPVNVGGFCDCSLHGKRLVGASALPFGGLIEPEARWTGLSLELKWQR
jgi:hypothetical protein